MGGGNLREYIDKMHKGKEPHDWEQYINWCVDAATGLAYLHGQNIIHRDVKSNNLLVCYLLIFLCKKLINVIDC